MIDHPYRLPLAQYLRVLELAQDLDTKILEEISIESVEQDIKRQLESALPASETGEGLKSLEALKREEQAVGRILIAIENEIQPVASKLTPGFAEHLREEYEEKRNAVQDRLRLSNELDKKYRQIREQEQEALEKKKETLLEAYRVGVGLPSVSDLTEEFKRIEEAEGEIKEFQERSAREWAALAERQIDQKEAKALWEKALQHDNSPKMCDRRDRHIAALRKLKKEPVESYEAALKEARELFERAIGDTLESLSKPENDLRVALEKCEYVIEALADYAYPYATRQEAERLKSQIAGYNDFTWHSHALGLIAQAELDLTSSNLDQGYQNLAHAEEAAARIWDDALRSSLADKIETAQGQIETKARQRTDRVIEKWRQQAEAHLEAEDAVAALNCLFAAQALSGNERPGDDLSEAQDTLESAALAMLSRSDKADAKSVAARGMEFLKRGDSQSAFRWLEAALQLDARAILSDSVFKELVDGYFEFEYKTQKAERLLFRAEYRLAQDPADADNMIAVEALLEEAYLLLEELGEADRLQEVEDKRQTLRQLHREALVEELDGLLQKLQGTWDSKEASSKEMTETLSVLKELTGVLAKFEKDGYPVEEVNPHLEKAFEYFEKLRSDEELKDNPNSIEGYSLSYMLLRKANSLENSQSTIDP